VHHRDFGRIKDVRTGQAGHRNVSQGQLFAPKPGRWGQCTDKH
jgi:hypothetical protein